MSSGKRYKKDDIKDLEVEEEKLQKQYQDILEEIENNKQKDIVETKEVIQKIKDDMKESTEQILDKIESESGVEKEAEKLNEIKAKIEELEKQAIEKQEDILILGKEESKKEEVEKEEVEKEVIFNIEDEDKDNKENINFKSDQDNLKTKNKKSDKKGSRALKVIGNIIYYIAFLFIVAVLVLVAVQRFSNNEMSIGGYRMFNILTDYNVGDILIAKTVEAKNIKLGDDVVYMGKEKPFVDIVVTHRVVDLNKEEDGTYSFLTRGIANDVDDPIITESQIYGKIIYKVHSFSLLSKAINNMYVFFFVIFIPIVLLVSIKILQIKHEKTEEYED